MDTIIQTIIRWQRKHKLQNWQIEELLRWLGKVDSCYSPSSFLAHYKDATD